MLQLQTEIATAVASALEITLLGNEAQKIEVGGTQDPAAFDAYLRATQHYWAGDQKSVESAIEDYGKAVRADPDYALAYAARSIARKSLATNWATTASGKFSQGTHPAVRDGLSEAKSDADKAVAFAPALSEALGARPELRKSAEISGRHPGVSASDNSGAEQRAGTARFRPIQYLSGPPGLCAAIDAPSVDLGSTEPDGS